MSALSTIRNNMGIVVVVVAISLLGFILTDLFSSMGNMLGGVPDAGVIAGKTITAQEFQERYQQASQNSNLPESQRFYLSDQVWNQMVNEIVFEQEFEKIGLKISGEEVYDMFTGKEIHPIVQQYFSGPEGYDRNQVKQILQQMLADSAQSAQLRLFEKYLADSRAQERYLNMVSEAFVASKLLVRQKHEEQNKKADLSFLGINYTQIPDSLVQVNDSELKAYLNEHKKNYHQEEQFYIKYVKFDITPTKADSNRAYQSLLKQKAAFAEVQNDSLFVRSKSRVPFSPSAPAKPIYALPQALQDSVANASEKQVFGPFLEGKFYKLYKVVDIETGPEAAVRIQHILITPEGSTPADTAAARAKAASLRARVNAANFADMVNENSRDFASKVNDGILGWYQKGTFGETFDKAVENAGVGAIIGPVKSNRGFHIVRILDKTRATFRIAEIEEEIYPSSETETAVFREANQFAAKAAALKNIDSAATEMGLNAVRSNALTKTSWQIIGLQPSKGTRDLVIWAVEAEPGELSEVTKTGDLTSGENFVVAQMDERIPEGTRPLELVRAEITRIVTNQKKAKIILDKLQGIATGDDLNAIKDSYGAGAFVSEAKGITFASTTIAGIGNDPLIIGRAMSLDEGQVSAPLEGLNGVYILKATAVQPAPELDDATLATRKATEADLGANALRSKIPSALVELADVEDNRYKIGY
ncbi:MAG: hypothetical protein D6730_23440 [Bacteroidetes bacterium]|nr:MAG: hypothetical protein D6730_23440 [Bacteroidota bacterium]